MFKLIILSIESISMWQDRYKKAALVFLFIARIHISDSLLEIERNFSMVRSDIELINRKIMPGVYS